MCCVYDKGSSTAGGVMNGKEGGTFDWNTEQKGVYTCMYTAILVTDIRIFEYF